MNKQNLKPFAISLAIVGSQHALAAGKTAAEMQSDISAVTEQARQEQQKLEERSQKATPEFPAGSKLKEQPASRKSVDVPVPPQSLTTPDPERAPLVNIAPPKNIRAWIGEELTLNGAAKGQDKGPEKTYFAWILNGVVVCQQQECRIPLDGRAITPGAHQLLFVAYNIQGSSISRHTLYVQKSSWTPSTALRSKTITSEPVDTQVVKMLPLNTNELHMTMMQGNAVHAFPENVIVVGSVPRNIPWEGQVKTAPRGVARITDPKFGKWFVLGNGQTSFIVNKSDPNIRSVNLEKGTIRAQSIEKADPKKKVERNNSIISTKEVEIFLDPSVDFAVTRVAPPAEATKRRNSAKNITDVAKSDQYQTRVVAISGTVRFQLPAVGGKASQTASVPPGVELVIYEDGKVGPFERPKPEFMEKLLRQTMTPEEIAERARRKAEALKKPVDIAEVLKRVEELAARSDYFEMLNELAVIEDRKDEDARISYNLGVAYRGLYQPLEAEKHFRVALNQDKKFSDPAWQLGLMFLDEKKWSDADEAFSEAKSRMPSSDKRTSEYEYYSGVAKFGVPSDFAARNSFSRALLWEDSLEQSLKASSGEFLKKLRERKDWSIVVPVGAQWEGNTLGLASDAAIPTGYTQKSVIRAIAGAMFTWDPAATRDAPGWYNGATANVMYAKHFPTEFKSFDSIILGGGASQIRKTSVEIPPPSDKPNEKPKNETRVMKFYENVQAAIVNSKFSMLTVTGGVNHLTLDASLGYERDTTSTANSSAVGKEQYGLKLWNGATGLASDLDIASEQRFAFTTSETYGHSISATLTPSLSIPINLITNAKVGSAFGAKKVFYGAETLSINIAPSTSLTRFITPWLVGMMSAGYEIVLENDAVPTGSKSRTVYKPSAGLTLSGLF